MKILLGGGTGFIGRNLQKLFKQKGYEVTVISRKAGEGIITWDQLKCEGLTQKYTAIVNLAGENILNPFYRWNDAFKRKVEASRIDTTKLLADLIKDTSKKPDVWVSSSAIGYYPPDPSKKYTEENDGGRGDYLAELCRRWEEASKIDSCFKEDENKSPLPIRHAIIRIGVVLGRDGGTIQKAYLPFYLGLGGKIGSGEQWFSWIHINDITNMFMFAIENKNVKGILNGTAPNPVTNAQFTKAFASSLNRPALTWLPEAYMNLVLGSERAIIVTKGQHVLPERVLKLGFKYEYPDIDSACRQFANL